MKRMNRRRRRLIGDAVAYAVLATGLLGVTVPYLWMFLTSFKPREQIFTRLLPVSLTLDHYRFILKGGEAMNRTFLRAALNSFLVAGIDTAFILATGALTGYVIAKKRGAGARTLNSFILLQLMFPFTLFIVPLLLIMVRLHLVNTYLGMILPFLTSAWATFMYSQFFKNIPDDLIDAARIDGCSESRTVFQIMLPLSMTVTVVVGLFTFMARWDEFLWNLLVAQDYRLMPLTVLLATFTKGEYGMYVGPQMAGAVLLTAPILLLFLACRGYFVRGIIMSGLKG